MYYVIYKITNLINNKIYIGKHRTLDLNDGYMGSGKYIKQAIKKYGIENFTKEILYYCTSEEEMNNLELQIVNKNFINQPNVYNINLGGMGSWDYVNYILHLNGNKMVVKNKTPEEIKAIREKALKTRQQTIAERSKDINYVLQTRKNLSDGVKRAWKSKGHPWVGKKHSLDTKVKMSASHKGKYTGTANSQYGKVWVYNLKLKQNKSIKKEDLDFYLNQGWLKGRKLNWD